MKIKYLPDEIQRIIYSYDTTYQERFKTCVEQLEYLYRVFPIKVNMIVTKNDVVTYIRQTPVRKLPVLNRFILDHCNRKRSLRSLARMSYRWSLEIGRRFIFFSTSARRSSVDICTVGILLFNHI